MKKKLPRPLAAGRGAVGQEADVAPGAEAPLATVVDEDSLDGRIASPRKKGLRHERNHAGGQGAQGLGSVEAQAADLALHLDQHLGPTRFSSSMTLT